MQLFHPFLSSFHPSSPERYAGHARLRQSATQASAVARIAMADEMADKSPKASSSHGISGSSPGLILRRLFVIMMNKVNLTVNHLIDKISVTAIIES